MARYTGAKCKLCRREGMKLFLKADRCFSAKCPLEKKGAVPPGQHGQKRSRRLSNYGQQLREKQKAKRLYGVLERQLRRYLNKAMKQKGATGKALLQILESRLDNIVYRLGFAPSRSAARQLVGHGHILIDGKKVNISSYRVKSGQAVHLTTKGMKMDSIKKTLADKKEVPPWLQRQAAMGRMIRLPVGKELGDDINEQLIVEYYSR